MTEPRIWPAVDAAFYDFSVPLEGCIPWLYSDVRGLITIGVGQLVDPLPRALSLPLRRPDSTLATPDEIEADWRAVKEHPDAARLGAPLARTLTRLRLTEVDIRTLVQWRLDEKVAALCHRFPDLPTWPAPAQLATLSLSWACGTGFRFPLLEAALRARDWGRASAECAIREQNNPGVAPRNARNRALYLLAAAIEAAGTDPSRLDIAPAPTPPPVDGADEAHALAWQTASASVNEALTDAFRGSDR